MRWAFINLDKCFWFIWKIQIIIMKLKVKIDSLVSTGRGRIFQKACAILILISMLLSVVSILIKNNDLLMIFGSIFLFLIFAISFLDRAVECFLSPFTSIRYFFLTSVVFNGILFLYFYEYVYSNSYIAISGFALIFCLFSLIANSKVAQIVNTIIEIILGIVCILAKFTISKLYKSVITSIQMATSDVATFDVATSDEIINDFVDIMGEYSINNIIDTSIYPLIIINGFALLICTVHSYWINKYNSGKEITWDNSKIQEYLSEIKK